MEFWNLGLSGAWWATGAWHRGWVCWVWSSSAPGRRGGRLRSLLPAPQNVYAPEEDPELHVERYERTFEQNEELGINDMRTEGYEAAADR